MKNPIQQLKERYAEYHAEKCIKRLYEVSQTQGHADRLAESAFCLVEFMRWRDSLCIEEDNLSKDYWMVFLGKPNVKKALEKKYESKEEKELVLMQIKEAGEQGLAALRDELTLTFNQNVNK